MRQVNILYKKLFSHFGWTDCIWFVLKLLFNTQFQIIFIISGSKKILIIRYCSTHIHPLSEKSVLV